jgi:5-methyltetrahydrofolate--homocysteine methyltransferase
VGTPLVNDVIIFNTDGERELARFSFPRQNKKGGLCIADFFLDVADGVRDDELRTTRTVIGLQVAPRRRRASGFPDIPKIPMCANGWLRDC